MGVEKYFASRDAGLVNALLLRIYSDSSRITALHNVTSSGDATLPPTRRVVVVGLMAVDSPGPSGIVAQPPANNRNATEELAGFAISRGAVACEAR